MWRNICEFIEILKSSTSNFGVLRAYGLALLSKRTREIAFLEIENWKEMQNTPEGDQTCMISYSEGRYRTHDT